VANQEFHQRRLRIDHVNNRVKCCGSVKDRSRLWQVGVRDLVRDLCCALHNAGFVFPVAPHDLIEINSKDDLAATAGELLDQQHLIGIPVGEAIRHRHQQHLKGPFRGQIP